MIEEILIQALATVLVLGFIGFVVYLYQLPPIDPHKDEVEEYRDFIDRVSADDFADWEEMRKEGF